MENPGEDLQSPRFTMTALLVSNFGTKYSSPLLFLNTPGTFSEHDFIGSNRRRDCEDAHAESQKEQHLCK